MVRHASWLAWLFAPCVTACGGTAQKDGSSEAERGGERQSCYPNQTCNAGLTCLSDLCVTTTDAGHANQEMDAAAGAADAALVLGGFDGAGVRETPLLAQVNRTKSWFTATDCSVDPKNCTVGGNEAPRVFDGTPFCTK